MRALEGSAYDGMTEQQARYGVKSRTPAGPVVGEMHLIERRDVFNKSRHSHADACRAFIRRWLANGPASATDILAASRVEGFSETMMKTARQKLGVVRTGNNRACVWSLPKPEARPGDLILRAARYGGTPDGEGSPTTLPRAKGRTANPLRGFREKETLRKVNVATTVP